MSTRFWRIGAKVPADVRARLIEAYPPRFPDVFCDSITWAYRVEEDYSFSTEVQECIVIGHHRAETHDALQLLLSNRPYRPDGKLLHITMSTAPGVQRAQTGDFRPEEVILIPQDQRIAFPVRLERFPLWNSRAKKRAA